VADVFWATSSGVYILNDAGSYIVFNSSGDTPFFAALTPGSIMARLLAGDPKGASSITCAADPPLQTVIGTAWTSGDGNYRRWDGSAWVPLPIALEDIFYATAPGGPYEKAAWAVTAILGQVSPEDYIVSFNAGGQSTAFVSFADFLSFYQARLKDLRAGGNRNFGAAFGYERHTPEGALP
jgi:hypothetical protein